MKEQLLTTLENSRRYSLAVAEAMPESAYDFKPTESVWNFRELLHHMAYGIEWWQANYVKGLQSPWGQPPVKGDKKGVIAYLQTAYDGLRDTINQSKLEDSAVKGLYATLDHTTHHRGQAVTYLRCKGITPPEYTF